MEQLQWWKLLRLVLRLLGQSLWWLLQESHFPVTGKININTEIKMCSVCYKKLKWQHVDFYNTRSKVLPVDRDLLEPIGGPSVWCLEERCIKTNTRHWYGQRTKTLILRLMSKCLYRTLFSRFFSRTVLMFDESQSCSRIEGYLYTQ